jgi:imidazolonepropionase-like amidohydrolase
MIDGTGTEPKEDWDVIVCDGKISDIGQNLSIPDEAKVIDLSGLTILPGLIDMHGHLYVNQGNSIVNQRAYLNLFLAGGVTTIYSPGEFDAEGTIELQKQISLLKTNGPDILTAGPYFDHAPSQIPWIKGVNSIEELEFQFNLWKDKIDGIKVYTRITETELGRLTKLADKYDLPVTGHLGSITASKAIDLGIDGIEHGIIGMPEFFEENFDLSSIACQDADLDLENPETESLIQKVIENQVYITPTIVTLTMLSSSYEPVTEWQKYVSEDILASLSGLNKMVQDNQQIQNCLPNAVAKQNVMVYEIHRRGGLIVTGTDPVVPMLTPGFALHREMELLVEAGLSPMDAIQAATLNAALSLRKEDEFGSIEIGKKANFVVVNGDPSKNISDIGNTIMVIKDGVQHDPAILRKSSLGKIGSESNY